MSSGNNMFARTKSQHSNSDEETGDFLEQRVKHKSSINSSASYENSTVFEHGKKFLKRNRVKAQSVVSVLPKDQVKKVLIQDYEFSHRTVTVVLGQMVEFKLSDDVPEHVEHFLEGTCSTNEKLNFTSGLLQV